MKKKYQIIGIIILMCCSVIYQFQKPEPHKIQTEVSSYIILEGAFLKEGEYEFKDGMTIQELIQQVGVKDNANMQALNLDNILKDESTLYLPIQSDNCISLNKASKEELMTLKGVGEKTAQKMIDYRQEHPFLYIEDIMKISGIGEKTYMKLRDSLCL